MKIHLIAIGALFTALPVMANDEDPSQKSPKQQPVQGPTQQLDKAPVLPRMIVVKVKVSGKDGALQEEMEPTICELQTQKTDVTDEAGAKEAIRNCEAQEMVQIPTEQEKLPEALQGCLTGAEDIAGEALDEAGPNAGRWGWGFSRGAGRYLYGHGFRGHYGHSRYRPWATPTYGYYYGGYRYPYSYRYSYPSGGYRYHYYQNPYYRWQ